MRLSISTVCTPELDWRQCLAEYGRAGYRAVELLLIPGWKHLTPGDVPTREVLAECRRTGVQLVAVHAGALDGASDAALAGSLAYLERVVLYAAELGVSLVNVNGGYAGDTLAPAQRPAALGRIGQALADLAPALSCHGLRLTLENHYNFQLETPDDYAAVLERVPLDAPIGVTVDTGHFTSAGVDIPAFVRAMGARVFHVHLKDHIGSQSMALGAGQTDNAAVLRALKDVGFEGHLSVEMEVDDRENALRYVQESLPYLTRLMEETGVA